MGNRKFIYIYLGHRGGSPEPETGYSNEVWWCLALQIVQIIYATHWDTFFCPPSSKYCLRYSISSIGHVGFIPVIDHWEPAESHQRAIHMTFRAGFECIIIIYSYTKQIYPMGCKNIEIPSPHWPLPPPTHLGQPPHYQLRYGQNYPQWPNQTVLGTGNSLFWLPEVLYGPKPCSGGQKLTKLHQFCGYGQ